MASSIYVDNCINYTFSYITATGIHYNVIRILNLFLVLTKMLTRWSKQCIDGGNDATHQMTLNTIGKTSNIHWIVGLCERYINQGNAFICSSNFLLRSRSTLGNAFFDSSFACIPLPGSFAIDDTGFATPSTLE